MSEPSPQVPINMPSRPLGRRASLRWIISSGVAGLAAAAGLSVRREVAAQEATPVPLPDDPHPSAGTGLTGTEFLFTQSFQSGTWAPKPGEEGVYTLTLSDVPPQIVYFSDRPERIFGVTPTQAFLDGLGFTPANPPNAALVAQTELGSIEEEVLILELLNPVYDPDSQTMTYDAHVLADYSGHGLAHVARQQVDYTLPASFAHGSLFIDDCALKVLDCAESRFNSCGLLFVPMCWNASSGACEYCNDPDLTCRTAFPGCYT